MTDCVPVQNSKFCVLFVNGIYRGIYCLKDNISKTWYADLNNISKKSVVVSSSREGKNAWYYQEVVKFCIENDMADSAKYEAFCNMVDVGNLVDWLIIQGVSVNDDYKTNVKAMKSDEIDGKWQMILFDLDGALASFGKVWRLLSTMSNGDESFYSPVNSIYSMVQSLLNNDDFRNRLISRYAEVYDTCLSNEKILARMNDYIELLEKDIPRDREYWAPTVMYPMGWDVLMKDLQDRVVNTDWQNYAKDKFCAYVGLSEEEKDTYFG